MGDIPQSSSASAPPPSLKGTGCLIYVGGVLGTMALIAVLSIFLGGRYFLKTFIAEYTSEKPAQLPHVRITDAQWRSLQSRLKTFRDAIPRTNGEVFLELSADDINALIERDPRFADFKDHLYVTLKGETATGQFSFLLENLGAQKILHGRYLNGEGQLAVNVVTENGKIYLTLLDIRVNGKTVPDTVKPGLQAHNLAARFNDDPEATAFIGRLVGITVQKGKVLIAANGSGSGAGK